MEGGAGWAGLYVGVEKPLEAAITADLIRSDSRGMAYGVLGSVNGVGDLVASGLVGMLWTYVSPPAAFGVAGALMLAGAALVRASAASAVA